MLTFVQSGLLKYTSDDEPLDTSYDEGTRALNSVTGAKKQLVGGSWVDGWYWHYVATPPTEPTTGHGLSTVLANSIVITQNQKSIREVVKTGDLGFTDQTTFTLGSAKMLEVDIILTYGIQQVLACVTYFQTRPGIYTHDVRIYGDEQGIQFNDYQSNGQFGLHISARGTWLLEMFVKNVIV